MDLLTTAYQALGEGTGAVTVVVAIIALSGAIAGSLVTYLTAGRTVYINAITVERSKWIEKLRNNIARYSTALARVSYRITLYKSKLEEKPNVTADDMLKSLEDLNEMSSVIQLQLNPFGEIDRNILSLIESIVIRTGMSPELLNRLDKALIGHSQWLLKAEWEKVKYEARGWFYRLSHFASQWWRLRAYRKWVAGEGSIRELMAEFEGESAALPKAKGSG